jgi:hypothetical protein
MMMFLQMVAASLAAAEPVMTLDHWSMFSSSRMASDLIFESVTLSRT